MPDALTIIAVDDELSNLELVKRVFGRSEHRLFVAASGAEAMQQVETHGADILLVDYSMPQMNGVEFIEKANALVPEAIAIMVTGYPELDEVADAQRRGLVSNILPKPWQASDLQRLVDAALTLRETRQSLAKVIKPG